LSRANMPLASVDLSQSQSVIGLLLEIFRRI
jgi:hypothetical protein